MNCPKVISNALHQVQSKVTRLVHDSENQFANYHYVSIDAYYALTPTTRLSARGSRRPG
jgi:hypothetical protein